VTRLAANCPSCGAPVEFVSAASVQTTCRYCTSVLVRADLDLRAVGVKATVPPSVSPIRLGTRGAWRGRRFEVVGRLVYAYQRGRWNEWHLAFEDGRTGWLSDAQAEYAVTEAAPAERIPAAKELKPGKELALAGRPWTVAAVTRAAYAGTEGELPFERWRPGEMTFADLRGADGSFATLDYSEDPPLLFTGARAEFEELALSPLREPEEVRAAAKTVACPNCGGSVTVRTADRAVSVVCQHCRSVLDARSEGFRVLQAAERKMEYRPKIPLGAAGTLRGHAWEAIGFQVRSIRVLGRDYPWDEYLLFSPAKGFAYLTAYLGHWSFGTAYPGVPRKKGSLRPTVEAGGRVYRHFQRAQAETRFVLGEFPWEARRGDRAMVSDYVAPPYLLSAEEVPGETTWTLSEYLPGTAVWRAFGLQGSPPAAVGVYANQPSPVGTRLWPTWRAALALLAVVLLLGAGRCGSGRTVGTGTFAFTPWADTTDAPKVIGPMDLDGRTSSVVVEVRAPLDNSWAGFDFALADSAGRATRFAEELGFYSGVEGGESWSEGSRKGSARISSVPAGRYWLSIDAGGDRPFEYEVKVRRDVPSTWMYVVAALLLLLPPAVLSLRAATFERARWAESDYAPSGGDE
jgi:ribosomal protein S27E